MGGPRVGEYDVRIGAGAEDDIVRISLYIETSAGSAEVASRWRGMLRKSIESLTTMPLRFPKWDRAVPEGRNVRKMVCGAYLVLYEVRESEIYVLLVHEGARRPPSKKSLNARF